MSEEMARALLGRHYEPQGSDSLEVQELRLQVRESAAVVQARSQELEVARLVLQRVKREFEKAIARQELGRSLPEVPHTDLIMIDTQGPWAVVNRGSPPTRGHQQSAARASFVSGMGTKTIHQGTVMVACMFASSGSAGISNFLHMLNKGTGY